MELCGAGAFACDLGLSKSLERRYRGQFGSYEYDPFGYALYG